MHHGLTHQTPAKWLRSSYPSVAAWENDSREPLARQLLTGEASSGLGSPLKRMGCPDESLWLFFGPGRADPG